jgi:hypothetical protein
MAYNYQQNIEFFDQLVSMSICSQIGDHLSSKDQEFVNYFTMDKRWIDDLILLLHKWKMGQRSN